jgi:myosin-6
MQSDPENLKALVSKVARWIVVNRWKKAIWCAISVQKCKNFHWVLWYTYGGRGGGG